jgi:hypothetical protein
MDTETVRVLIGAGFFMMLLVLRLDAKRFGTAEYDEPGESRGGPWTRISWYLIGLALLGALYFVFPAPHDVLSLLVGHWSDVAYYGAIVAALGLGLAAVIAWLRYGYLRLPAPTAYPGAAVNSIATAVIDEAVFRGALLGALMAIGLPVGWAILIATIVYILVARIAAPGRHWSMLLVAAFIGGACGWAMVASGGLGAAVIGHAVTSFAVFVCTGHAGQVPAAGREPEEIAVRKLPPPGWQGVRSWVAPGNASEGPAFAEPIGPSGFSSRAGRDARKSAPRGLLPRLGSRSRPATGRPAMGQRPRRSR